MTKRTLKILAASCSIFLLPACAETPSQPVSSSSNTEEIEIEEESTELSVEEEKEEEVEITEETLNEILEESDMEEDKEFIEIEGEAFDYASQEAIINSLLITNLEFMDWLKFAYFLNCNVTGQYASEYRLLDLSQYDYDVNYKVEEWTKNNQPHRESYAGQRVYDPTEMENGSIDYSYDNNGCITRYFETYAFGNEGIRGIGSITDTFNFSYEMDGEQIKSYQIDKDEIVIMPDYWDEARDPVNGVFNYQLSYDANKRLETIAVQQDYGEYTADNTQYLSYDDQGRLSAVTSDLLSIPYAFTYNEQGLLGRIVNEEEGDPYRVYYDFEYDELGRLIHSTETMKDDEFGDTYTIEYFYTYD